MATPKARLGVVAKSEKVLPRSALDDHILHLSEPILWIFPKGMLTCCAPRI